MIDKFVLEMFWINTRGKMRFFCSSLPAAQARVCGEDRNRPENSACIILQVGQRGQNKHSWSPGCIKASVARGILWFSKGIYKRACTLKREFEMTPAATAVERYSKKYVFTWYENLREVKGAVCARKIARPRSRLLGCIWVHIRRWSGWKSTRVTPQNTRKRKWNAQH